MNNKEEKGRKQRVARGVVCNCGDGLVSISATTKGGVSKNIPNYAFCRTCEKIYRVHIEEL